VKTHALTLREDPQEAEAGPESGHAHSGGSVASYPDSDAAEAELTNCERSAAASGALFCLRVENVLVILGGDLHPDEIRRVERAGAALGG
jgi:hypothetical protein